MLVRYRMSSKVITVEPQSLIEEARALLQRHRIRQLPVMRKQRLIGIVTDRDLRGAVGKATTVADLMTAKPVVISPNHSVDEAARVLVSQKIGALPVVERNKLIGILTSSDILEAFVDLSGVGEATYRVILSGAKGRQAAERVRHVVTTHRGELKWAHPDPRDPSKLHLRLKARRIDDVVDGLGAAGFEVTALVAPGRAVES